MTNCSHILLFEDSAMDVELTLRSFKGSQQAVTIHVARTGQEGLDYLFGLDQYADRQMYPLPCLVLLDLKMPRVDGIEILRQLKSTPILKRIPVVILTSSNQESDRALSYDYGANGYLVKPVSFGDFSKLVRIIYDFWLVHNVIADPQ